MKLNEYRIIRREFGDGRVVYIVQHFFVYCTNPYRHKWDDVQEHETEQLAQEAVDKILGVGVAAETVI